MTNFLITIICVSIVIGLPVLFLEGQWLLAVFIILIFAGTIIRLFRQSIKDNEDE